MQIDFKSGIDRVRAAGAVEAVAALLNVPEQAVERVIVTDRFGETIAEVLGQPAAKTHTDTKDMQAVGRTIPRRGTDGLVTSTVILPAAIVEKALGHNNPDFRGDPLSAEQGHYVIGHELGHGKDYAARSTTQPSKPDMGEPFRLDDHHRYCGRILLEEFFACAHSGRVASDRVTAYVAESRRESLDGLLDHVFDLLTGFWQQQATAHVLKLNVTHTYWRVLVEQTQLVGMAVGRGRDLAVVPSVWPTPNDKSRALDVKLAETLSVFWQSYPVISANTAQAALVTLWQEAIQVERGYRFVPGAREDVLHVSDKLIG